MSQPLPRINLKKDWEFVGPVCFVWLMLLIKFYDFEFFTKVGFTEVIGNIFWDWTYLIKKTTNYIKM